MHELTNAEIDFVSGSASGSGGSGGAGWLFIADAVIDFAQGFWQGVKDATGKK